MNSLEYSSKAWLTKQHLESLPRQRRYYNKTLRCYMHYKHPVGIQSKCLPFPGAYRADTDPVDLHH